MLLQAAIILQLLQTAGKGDWDTDSGVIRTYYSVSQDKIACHLLLLCPSGCVLTNHTRVAHYMSLKIQTHRLTTPCQQG